MRAWQWLKSLPWLVTLGMLAAAIFMVLNGRKIDRLQKRAEKKNIAGIDLKNTEISTQINKGKQLVESAHKDKTRADEIRVKLEDNLKVLGERSETIDDIADRFNSKRVRR